MAYASRHMSKIFPAANGGGWTSRIHLAATPRPPCTVTRLGRHATHQEQHGLPSTYSEQTRPYGYRQLPHAKPQARSELDAIEGPQVVPFAPTAIATSHTLSQITSKCTNHTCLQVGTPFPHDLMAHDIAPQQAGHYALPAPTHIVCTP
jgi:hypothetical protein